MRINNRKRIIGIVFCLIFNIVFLSNFSYADSLPTKYDLREKNGVTPVKDQGEINSCWAFAALSSLESNIKLKENKEYNLSENNMITNHGFDLGAKDGGNIYMATAYLTSWKGAVLEQKDPYSKDIDPVDRGIKKSDYHVQNVIYIPNRKTFNDNEKIKKAIMNYGAVYTALEWNESFYNQNNNSYICNSAGKGNHAVAIVGWDDNYSKDNFKEKASADGAFICKNSAGDNWGENGYFYVSYYDFNIGKKENAIFLASDEDYDNIYQYDELGQTLRYGYSNETAWFSNVFTVKDNEGLSGAGFYTTEEDSNYEIWICRNFENINSFKKKEKIKEGKINTTGYHTISLDEVELNKNEKIGVIVKLTTKKEKNPIAIETPSGKYASKANANENESFISSDGSKWSDLTSSKPNSNVCLKIFTNNKNSVQEKGKLEIEVVENDESNIDKGQASITLRIRNNEDKSKNVALMVGLYDENNKMVNHSCINKEIKANEEVILIGGVLIPDKGKYTLKGFLWDDSDNGISLMKNPIKTNIQ
ncbi:MAG: lectin like domain-containing protein [Tepidibacter sp.]|jgi:C1A family cysteine protease|uniref:lectin like domain-containing protein n=1 Tax=Tepidibacter sp. TaxID=2529387 RepID=UPI0025F58039|nr:lectin like domain-containing protein [Tepidibacter sp.]MCT4507358.1 lectin like domain-containing protein [Tepidibacter sp.]